MERARDYHFRLKSPTNISRYGFINKAVSYEIKFLPPFESRPLGKLKPNFQNGVSFSCCVMNYTYEQGNKVKTTRALSGKIQEKNEKRNDTFLFRIPVHQSSGHSLTRCQYLGVYTTSSSDKKLLFQFEEARLLNGT